MTVIKKSKGSSRGAPNFIVPRINESAQCERKGNIGQWWLYDEQIDGVLTPDNAVGYRGANDLAGSGKLSAVSVGGRVDLS
jgi:hypothetical protein